MRWQAAVLPLLLLTACGGRSATPPGALGQAAATPAPTPAQTTPLPFTARSGPIRLAQVFGNPGPATDGQPKPLYGANPADAPALQRLAAMLGGAQQQRPDAQVRRFPIALPGNTAPPVLSVEYANGSSSVVSSAYRCLAPGDDPQQCAPADGWVILNEQGVYAPDLFAYLSRGGFRADMPAVQVMVLDTPAAPRNGPLAVQRGAGIAVHGSAAVDDPLQLLLFDRAVGLERRPNVVLATLAAPIGDWSWRGRIPADLPSGEYSLCAGEHGACAVWLSVH